MYNFIQINKIKIFKSITILIVVFAVIGIGLLINYKSNKSENLIDIRMPVSYDQPLIIVNSGSIFSIQPVNASTFAKVTVGKQNSNIVKYIDAYQNTDVVQTKYSNKLKEDIILKQPGHPEIFEYKLDLDNYDFERDGLNNFIFYKKGHQGDELYKIFTIPAPFMFDANGKVSNNRQVETTLSEEGILILKPSQKWLDQAVYPVVLDPSVEIHVLNVQSYPTVGGPWEVRFTTQGTEDLIVTGMSHDEYHTVFGTDIDFFGLKCGDEIRQPEFDKATNSYLYKNWQCDKVAYFTDTVLQAGKHHLQFDFGGQLADAYNDATGFTDPTSNGTGSNFDSPTYAFTSDDNRALGLDTYVIDVDTFGFSLSSGSTINGIEARIEWSVSSSAIFNLGCQLLDATGSPLGNIKTTAQNSSLSDITEILGSTSDMWGTSFGQSDVEDADFGVRCTAAKNYGGPTSYVQIDNIDIQITYTAPASNNTPTITSVTDSPDPVVIDNNVSFPVDWNDADAGENIKAKICKTNSLTNQNCDGGYWATSTAFTTNDPEVVSYTTQAGDEGANNYYAFVCDDEAACSSATSGSFTVVLTKMHLKSGTIKINGGIIKINLLDLPIKLADVKLEYFKFEEVMMDLSAKFKDKES